MQKTRDRSNSREKKCQQTNKRTSVWKVRSKRARSDYYIYMLIFIRMYKASIRTCTIQNYGKLQRTKPKLMLTILQRHETQRPHLHTYAMFRVLCCCSFLHFHLRPITSAVTPICSCNTRFFLYPFSVWYCIILVRLFGFIHSNFTYFRSISETKIPIVAKALPSCNSEI